MQAEGTEVVRCNLMAEVDTPLVGGTDGQRERRAKTGDRRSKSELNGSVANEDADAATATRVDDSNQRVMERARRDESKGRGW